MVPQFLNKHLGSRWVLSVALVLVLFLRTVQRLSPPMITLKRPMAAATQITRVHLTCTVNGGNLFMYGRLNLWSVSGARIKSGLSTTDIDPPPKRL